MKLIKTNQNLNIIIDDEDFNFLNQFKWYIKNNGSGNLYAVRQDKFKKEYSIHRTLLGITDSTVHVDHINGNSLDNRKSNLRKCNNAENRKNMKLDKRNKTGYKGVSQRNNKYLARIAINGKQKHLGYFNTPEEAAKAYNNAAITLHGKFARLNVIDKS